LEDLHQIAVQAMGHRVDVAKPPMLFRSIFADPFALRIIGEDAGAVLTIDARSDSPGLWIPSTRQLF
jgi:hypothetical protein